MSIVSGRAIIPSIKVLPGSARFDLVLRGSFAVLPGLQGPFWVLPGLPRL